MVFLVLLAISRIAHCDAIIRYCCSTGDFTLSGPSATQLWRHSRRKKKNEKYFVLNKKRKSWWCRGSNSSRAVRGIFYYTFGWSESGLYILSDWYTVISIITPFFFWSSSLEELYASSIDGFWVNWKCSPMNKPMAKEYMKKTYCKNKNEISTILG